MLTQTTYLFSMQDCATTRGTKGMRSKVRLTIMICSYADGSLKAPLEIIGKSKNPRCFLMEKLPCTACFRIKGGVVNTSHEIVCFPSILDLCAGACAVIQKDGASYGQL